MPDKRPIRYAAVGAGWIVQETVLPAFRNAKNSALKAIVTRDSGKAKKLSEAYQTRAYSYEEYDRLLHSGEIDAVYIGLPNSLHADFSIRAAKAGIHVLCEKPMASNVAECEAMIQAAEENRIKLMIAYRLHFEPGNLKVVELIQSGAIGEPRVFNSVFCQQVEEGNSRLSRDLSGGPLMDMGVYPINAARYVFRDEPLEVMAFGANNGERRFREVHEAVSATMRFPGDKLASFTCSFGAAAVDAWFVVGTKGAARLQPGFEYHDDIKLHTIIEGEEQEQVFPKHDQFGPELLYFSDCILENRDPEPNGREGLADMRIVEALLRSMREHKPVQLDSFTIDRRPEPDQAMRPPAVEPATIVHAESPSKE